MMLTGSVSDCVRAGSSSGWDADGPEYELLNMVGKRWDGDGRREQRKRQVGRYQFRLGYALL